MAGRSQPQSFGSIDFDALTSTHSIDGEQLRTRLSANLGTDGTTEGS